MDAISQDYEHVWPPYNQSLPPAHAGAAPEALRTFDVLTPPERMGMWCASLERRIEDLALRVAYLEMQAHRQANAPAQRVAADVMAHRLLNPGDVDGEEVEP